ncbi:DUF1963 domain-containing protein [Streptomyces sp. NPDC090741]|uniref:DUF1963 domain-containing protein n=1 Tax=Streptomyces sp. NPDC090741 TaxID=3365967 RepID=UPI00382F7D70
MTSNASLAFCLVCLTATRSRATSGAASTLAAPNTDMPQGAFDTDDAADMMWGDAGVLYWLIRPQDLAECRFDRAMFTWQCS